MIASIDQRRGPQFASGKLMRDVAAVVAREFIDRAGVLWHVVEVDARHTPGARGDRCLLFSSPGAIRRVWHYPAEWSRVPAEELDALSWRL